MAARTARKPAAEVEVAADPAATETTEPAETVAPTVAPEVTETVVEKRRLKATVYLTDPDGSTVSRFGPGDDIPEWAAAAITNPKAWSDQ